MKKSEQSPKRPGLVARAKLAVSTIKSKVSRQRNASLAAAALPEIAEPRPELALSGIMLPRGAWYSLFRNFEMGDLARFSRSCRGANVLYKDYLQDEIGARQVILFQGIVPKHLLLSAEKRGIKLNYRLLRKLSRISPAVFNELHKLPASAPWPLAAICGDIQWLQQHLAEELLSKFSIDEMQVLHYMAFGGQYKSVEYMLSNHLVTPQELAADQKRIIYYAALGGDEDTLNYLSQQHKFDLTQQLQLNLDRFNILQPLAAGGHLKLLWAYIEHHRLRIADAVTHVNNLFMTAASQGHFEVCDFLTASHQENPMQKNICNQTLAHFAARYGDLPRLIKLLLLEPALQTLEDSHALTPFDYCIVGGHLKMLEFLVFDRDITHRRIDSSRQDSYLHLACQYRQVHLIEPLVKKYHIPVDIQNVFQQTPLTYCAFSGSWECANKLLQLAPKINPLGLDQHEMSIHFHAVEYGQIFFLEQVIKTFGGLNPKSKDGANNTPLHFAFKSFSRFVVRYIHNNFCDDVCVINNRRDYPINFAAISINNENFSQAWPFILAVAKFYTDEIMDYTPTHGKSIRRLAEEQNVVELFEDSSAEANYTPKL